MSASLASGTYGRQPVVGAALLNFFGGLLATRTVRRGTGDSLRMRIREANEVRELARSVELSSPGFAADLYAAASRHEGAPD